MPFYLAADSSDATPTESLSNDGITRSQHAAKDGTTVGGRRIERG
jgi:hypothetical protein